jgi:hypothetical protein
MYRLDLFLSKISRRQNPISKSLDFQKKHCKIELFAQIKPRQ